MKRIFTAIFFVLLTCSISVLAQSESQEDLLKQIEAKRADLAVLENKILSPSAEDKAASAEFLKQENTGLIRLLPREKYAETPDKMTLTVRGGGAYYSFDGLTHDGATDIELQQGNFSVGFAGCDYGIILKAGAVSLDEISVEHPSVSFLAAYKAAATEPQARVEQRRFGTGDVIDGIKYGERVKAEVGMTYILRSINYDYSDLLVALKVVRQDTDGSLIIAWKLLQKFPKPVLARNIAAQ